MNCSRCKSRCADRDLSRTPTTYSLPFGKLGKGRICLACQIELGTSRGEAPVWRKTSRTTARLRRQWAHV